MAGPFTIYLAGFSAISTEKLCSSFRRWSTADARALPIPPRDGHKTIIPLTCNLLRQLGFQKVADASAKRRRLTLCASPKSAG